MSICGWCGLVHELDEMRQCEIRGTPSRICRPCFKSLERFLGGRVELLADVQRRDLWAELPAALP